MRSTALLIAAFLGTAFPSQIAHSQCLPYQSSIPEKFVIEQGHIKLPVGAFLLVRKSGRIGGIRILKIDPVGAQWLGKSTYESYAGALKSAHPIRNTGEIDLHASAPKDTARIGKWSLAFTSPNEMTMPPDHGYEFTPTSACTPKDIDPRDTRLQWFRSDSGPSLTLSVADLAK